MQNNRESQTLSWADMMEMEDQAVEMISTMPGAEPSCKQNQNKRESQTLSWGDMMEMEDQAVEMINTMPGTEPSCQQNQRRQPPAQLPAQDHRTPHQRQQGGHQVIHQASYQRPRGGHQVNHQAPYHRQQRSHQVYHQNHQASYQRPRGGHQVNHQAPYHRQQRSHQVYHQNHQASYQTPRGGHQVNHQTPNHRQQRSHQVYHQNHQAPYYQEHQARTPPAWQVEEQANHAEAQDMARVQKLEDQVASLRKNLDNERQRASSFQQQREVSRNTFQVLLRKERKQVRDLYAAKCSLEEQVKKLQEDAYSRAMEGSKNTEKIQELNDLVSSLSNKLEAEMLKTGNLQTQLDEAKLQLLEENNQELQLDDGMDEEKDILETKDDLLMETSENEDQGETFEVTGEDIREPSPELDNTLVDSEEDGPHTVQETREMTLPTPEVIAEATELESISLWRRFKKAMTPKHRRKYKRQRQD
ncbi:ELKS/Rab6-interacting/CAST family member 1-like [Xyrichtys novacula]|uniref:ELKS/Rab6-interacting/CAST family member 1-like n=1 Tax=Xyrichtys novacula TaxID=13765 RepID=A0AAV1FSP3_XYRNO|nr:ELKS/Rab6-interacting/CAST family member 1-like [Xyrichtys novacula]